MVCCGHFKVFKSGLMLVIATFRLGFDLDILALFGSENVSATFSKHWAFFQSSGHPVQGTKASAALQL